MSKPGLHLRNRQAGRYDFEQLRTASPALARFIKKNLHGDISIDFGDPDAVKELNRALLRKNYGITVWDIPPGYLCPPVPGRADLLHHAADLLGGSNNSTIPHGDTVQVLDIGVGANCIYPLIGRCEYGWSFVGTDIDPVALEFAARTVDACAALSGGIELRLQKSATHIFRGVLKPTDRFELTLCNPPFHASLEEANESTQRKWRGLGRDETAARNFGGQGCELWAPGGELAFVKRLIKESRDFGSQVLWFTSLVSKESNLPQILNALENTGASESGTIDMAQGQKKSRLVAWTFLDPKQQAEWPAQRKWK